MVKSEEIYSHNIQEQLPSFHQSWWLDVVAKSSWNYKIEIEDDNTFGVLPYLAERKFGFRFLGMPPYTPFLGPSIISRKEKSEIKLELIRSLLHQLPRYHVFKQNMIIDKSNLNVFEEDGFSLSKRVTYKILTEVPEDNLWKKISSTRKNLINRGEKKLEVREGERVTEFIKIQEKTFSRKGIKPPQSLEMLKKLVYKSVEMNSGILLMAGSKNDPNDCQAAGFFVWDKHTMYYIAGGYDDSDKKGEAMSFLLWNGILLAKEKNLTFDFEGSMVPGIAEFFRSFGSEASTYYQVVKVKPSLLKFYFFLRGVF